MNKNKKFLIGALAALLIISVGVGIKLIASPADSAVKPIGVLKTNADADLLIEKIENSKALNLSDKIYNIPACLKDIYNADLDGTFSSASSKERVSSNDIFMVGELIEVGNVMRKSIDKPAEGNVFSYKEKRNLKFTFEISEVLVGYPEYAQIGSKAVVYCPVDFLSIPQKASIIQGDKYLIQACYDGLLSDDSPYPMELTLKKITPYDDYNSADFENIMAIAQYNLHAVNVVTTKDMSLTPTFLDTQGTYSLTSGRLIEKKDYLDAAAVCVVRDEFLKTRNLKIGDSISLTFPENDLNYYREYLTDDNILVPKETTAQQYTIVGSYSLDKDNASFPLSVLYND
ncbi:MAG: hypothetical protein RR198_07765, partial [Oscillospiraceae bacterium]